MDSITSTVWNLRSDILLAALILLIVGVIYLYITNKMRGHKERNTLILSEYSQSIQKLEVEKARLTEIIQLNEIEYNKSNTFYFYFSPSQAKVTRNNQLGRHSTYIKHYIEGKEFTEILHISQPQVPSFKDAELVFSGKPKIDSIPYTNMDKPVSFQFQKSNSGSSDIDDSLNLKLA